MPRSPLLPALILLLLPACRSSQEDGQAHPPQAVAELRAVTDAYRAAWLRGDSAAVLRLFAADAVLLPHHGDPPVVGRPAMAAFWWPPSAPATTVTALEQTIDGARADGHTGIVWGRFSLAFSYQEEGQARALRNAGTYLMVLRREAGGEWRITHRMWDDPVAQPVRP